VTFIEPSRYPERLASLFYSVSLAHRAVLVVEEINATLGECILMLDCIGLQKGVIVLRNYIPQEQVDSLIRGTVVERYEYVPDDHPVLRERFISEALAEQSPAGGPCAIPVDHFFNVKGIGTVALGSVASGEVRRHDQLGILPGKKTAQVRSIQRHDDDAETATAGDRVGLALKGVDATELDRGDVLTNDPRIASSGTISGRATLVRYWPGPLKGEMVLYVGHWMQFLSVRLAFVDNSGDWHRPSVTMKSDKDLVYLPGDRAVIHYLEGGKLRIVGTLILS
jgi:selenocysteine-specific translation elongation factor